MKGARMRKRRDGSWERVREAAPDAEGAPADRLAQLEARIVDLEEKVVKLHRSKAEGARLTELEDKVAEIVRKPAPAETETKAGAGKKEKA